VDDPAQPDEEAQASDAEQTTERAAKADKAFPEQQLFKFVERAWKVLEPQTDFVEGFHIEAICDHLEAVTRGKIQNLLINIPPRHMKSLTVSVFWPVWEWIANPHRRWLFASYAMSLSVRDSVRCRRLIESPWFQSNWGKNFRLTSDQNTKQRFDNDKGGCRLAVSVGSAATGEGGDRVVVDDPHNVTERESDAIRRATLDWWDQTMCTRLNDPKTGARVIVMQRVHEKDLSGHVIEQGGYVHLCLPAEYESSRRCSTILDWSDTRTTEGELLWPKRISQSEIADFKLRLGPSGYAGQFQQRPTPAGGARFRQEWFRYFWSDAETRGHGDAETSANARVDSGSSFPASPRHRVSASFHHLAKSDGTSKHIPVESCTRFAIMDPAGTEPDQNTKPCYTVIQVWDVTPDHEMLLVHQYRAQVQAPDAAEAAIRIVREFDAEFIGIEKDGIGLGIVQSVKRSGITVKSIKARGSKEARSETAEIRMAAGLVYFPRSAPFLFELEQELLHFPLGEYADQVDALSHAAMLVHRRGGPPAADPPDQGASAPADEPDEEPFFG